MSDGESDGRLAPAVGPRGLLKSWLGFSWAMSLFGLRTLETALDPQRAAASLGAVTRAMLAALPGGALRGEAPGGAAGAGVAGGGPAAGAGSAGPPAVAPPPPPVRRGRLDTTTFVTLGEGLAAGVADFSLSARLQQDAFPAQMARQMQTGFRQALLQAPGIGNLPGFPPLPVSVPALMQTTVLEPQDAVGGALGNLSVPGFRLADALHLRPAPPLIQRDDARQTGANLILGLPELLRRPGGKLPTQLETALGRRPTLALVELGYLEAIEATVTGDLRHLPSVEGLRRDLGRLLGELRRGGAAVLVMNLPDPLDSACAPGLAAAAQVVKLPVGVLAGAYGLAPGDRITVSGLVEIGFQALSHDLGALPAGSVLAGEVAARIGERIGELNAEVARLAWEHGALVCDLHGLWRSVRDQGVQAGGRRLTAGFLGGFYSLNGYYPGKTGHAVIANLALQLLNQSFGAEFPLVDLGGVVATDPVAMYRPAAGPELAAERLRPSPPRTPSGEVSAGGAVSAVSSAAAAATAARAASPALRRGVAARQQRGEWPPPPDRAPRPFELPPGLEVVLPLNPERSYFGEAIRAVDCQDPAEQQFGTCPDVLFGGVSLLDSHLHGQLRIRFAPPVGNFSRFEVTLGEGLAGDDGTLASPWFFKLPAQQCQVKNYPGTVSAGWVDVTTGEVVVDPENPLMLGFTFDFWDTAILALLRVNPNLQPPPIAFPGRYGSAWARFGRGPDGELDFEFFGTTLLPLGGDLGGEPVRYPLPFAGETLEFASIPARGCALHPHIYLSTRASDPVLADPPEIPTNTIREYTCLSHNTSFGDQFTLQSPVLGGDATGRAQLVGRILVQFGERAANSVPIYVSAMIPGGYLAPMPPSPISEAFPGRLSPGPIGFNEHLRFPRRSYFLDDVFLLSDPWDLSVAAVDCRTGRVLGEQLHRGFIGQNLFFALLRVEPRTPKASFLFRGPATFQRTPRGQTVYRFQGQVHIPYPTGFLFPNPNLATGFPVDAGSALDPYFWVQAMDGGAAPPASFLKAGEERDLLASSGDRFSYRYAIPADPRRRAAVFEYTNSSQQGTFRLQSLTWVGFDNTRLSRDRQGAYDVVTFAGFGVWSRAGVEDPIPVPATVQISTAAGASYVGIQIGGGAISNVDTKPELAAAALP